MKLENYFRRFGIRNGSGAESSVSAVHLHYCRSADRLRPEHYRRSRKDRRYCKHHENRRPPIRQSPVRRIPLRNLPACQCRSLRPACQVLRRTAGKIRRTQILAVLACCIADFLIAQLGLLTLIQKAYSILAYLAIPVILVPYVVHMIATRFDTK